METNSQARKQKKEWRDPSFVLEGGPYVRENGKD